MLHIFDIDGTLTNWKTGEFLPGVLDWFSKNKNSEVALATNQGGPACRDAGWGDKYPTLEDTVAKYEAIADRLNAILYMSLAYKNKSNCFYYPLGIDLDDRRLRPSWRKPGNGMLLQAMKDFGSVTAVMVGDKGDDHRAALDTPGCSFVWAKDFFKGWNPMPPVALKRRIGERYPSDWDWGEDEDREDMDWHPGHPSNFGDN